MAPVPTAKADGAKIRELIRERGTVAAFARKLGRHPQTFWDMANPNRDLNVSITFLRQIARELGVRLSDISDASDDAAETTNPRRWVTGDAEPEALASLDAKQAPAAVNDRGR